MGRHPVPARAAVDEYFEERNAMPLVLPTGRAIVFKSLEEGTATA